MQEDASEAPVPAAQAESRSSSPSKLAAQLSPTFLSQTAASGFGPEGPGVYEYIDPKKARATPFTFQNFNWADHAFATLSRYNAGVAESLSDEFQAIKDLTYGYIGNVEGVDTFKFRWAIWNYVFSLYGITDREYLFTQVDELVQGTLREWIRTLACYPDRATLKRFNECIDFTHSEKVHVCLLVIEARQMAELLYCLQAVDRFADK